MKIAHVVPTFYPRHGGMGVVAFDEASELVRRGHSVSVLTMRYGGDARTEEKNGFAIKRLQPLARLGDGGIVYFGSQFKDFDVVHLHLPWYGSAWLIYLALRLSKKPYVVTLHMEGQLRGIRKLYKKIGDLVILPCILKKAGKVFVVNKEYFVFAQYLKKVDQEKIVELSNPIDTTIFCPGERDASIFEEFPPKADQPWAGAGKHVILFVGNLLPLKRLDLLLRAVAGGDASWRLAVVGGGYAEAEYRALTKNLGLDEKVKFFGSIARTELPNFYRTANCVVVPSQSESFSLVAAEALACGTPVVVSAVPGASNQAVMGAVTFEPGSVNSLVAALQKVFAIVNNFEQIDPIFDLPTHIHALELVYSEII